MAQSVIGALRVNLGLDSAEFSEGLKKAENSSSKFASAMKVGFAAAAAAATAALGGLAVAVRANLSAIDDLAKTSSKIGIPIEELSKLKYAADLSGVSMQGLQTGVQRLSRNMADAAKGTGEGAKAFERLGIQVKDSDGRLKSSSAVLAELADRFQKMPDGAEKTALAMQLMGRSGADMIPMLNGGSEALNGLIEEAKSFGLEISAETGKAAEAFNDNMSRIGYAINGVGLSLTAALAPVMVVVSDALVGLARGFISLLDYLPQVAEYAAVAGGSLALMAAPAILASVQSLTVAIGVGLVGALRAVAVVMAANPLGALAVGIAVAVTAIYHFRDEIQKAIGVDVVQVVKTAANFIINSFRAVVYDIKLVVGSIPDVFIAAGEAAANGFLRAMNQMVRSVIVTINTMIASVQGAMRGTFLEGFGNSIPMIENRVPLHKVDIGGAAASDRLGEGFGGRNSAIADIMGSDPIGALGASFEASTPAVLDFSAAMDGAAGSIANVGNAISGGGGGSGGGAGEGATNGMLAGLEQLRQSLMTAEEAERNSYANRLIAIQEYYDAGLIQKAEYDDLMERAHQEHTDRMAEITRRGVEEEMRMRGQLVGNLSSVMGSLSSILEKTGDKNLAAAKAFAVAEAIINTAQGITKALAQGGMFGFAGAAAVAAAGAAQIATILSANKGSSRRPAVSGSGAASGSGEITRNDTPSGGTVNLQIQGLSRDELYSGEQVRELMDRMVELQRDGYQLVVVDT